MTGCDHDQRFLSPCGFDGSEDQDGHPKLFYQLVYPGIALHTACIVMEVFHTESTKGGAVSCQTSVSQCIGFLETDTDLLISAVLRIIVSASTTCLYAREASCSGFLDASLSSNVEMLLLSGSLTGVVPLFLIIATISPIFVTSKLGGGLIDCWGSSEVGIGGGGAW
jgi:hypothetical protein